MITMPWCYFVVDENEGTQLDMEGMTTIDMEGMVVTIYGSLRTNAPIMKGKLSAVAKVCRIRSYQGSRSQPAHSFKNVLEGGN